ncbi:MAG: DUF4249 domain-containing protein [Maribacter sp.]|nr:DUF4249 domain-containing protein [Maribacter sp.]
MISKKRVRNILPCFLFLALAACTEPFPIATIKFEDILVVESTITNELKRQVVKLSRTIDLTDLDQAIIDNANVKVEGSDGSVFDFSQDTETRHYISNLEFQAMPDIAYTLKINTPNSQSYSSTAVSLTPVVEIDRVYPELRSENGKEGVQVMVDADNINGMGQYFRYEYEETYEILLPNTSGVSWSIFNVNDFTRSFEIVLGPKRIDEKCYSTIESEGIVQTSTSNLGENGVFRFPLRFIAKMNPIIKEQYSILVKQYVQSQEAYTFYQILEGLGNVEGHLSQGQPGFVSGNINSETDSEEKVLGFFEASSVSSQRFFFNYTDFGFDLPPYFVECDVIVIIGRTELLKRKLEFENYQIFFFEMKIVNGPVRVPIYHIAQSECTECASFSTHIKPAFWED